MSHRTDEDKEPNLLPNAQTYELQLIDGEKKMTVVQAVGFVIVGLMMLSMALMCFATTAWVVFKHNDLETELLAPVVGLVMGPFFFAVAYKFMKLALRRIFSGG